MNVRVCCHALGAGKCPRSKCSVNGALPARNPTGALCLRPRINLKGAAVYRRALRVSTTTIPSKSKPPSANRA